MFNPNLPDANLLQALLEPLLDDFLFWFERCEKLLETETLDFLPQGEQADLLTRIQQAQQEVRTAQMLFKATSGQVGVDMNVIKPWHQLVMECWRVSLQFRSQPSD